MLSEEEIHIFCFILCPKWKSLSREEQQKYYEEAEKQRILHQLQYPGWSTRDNYVSPPWSHMSRAEEVVTAEITFLWNSPVVCLSSRGKWGQKPTRKNWRSEMILTVRRLFSVQRVLSHGNVDVSDDWLLFIFVLQKNRLNLRRTNLLHPSGWWWRPNIWRN